MGKKGLVSVVIAGVAGFVTGILIAPKSGEETRKELKQKAQVKREEANKKMNDVNLALKKGRTEVEGFAKNVADHAGALGEDAKTRAARVAEEAKRTADKVQK